MLSRTLLALLVGALLVGGLIAQEKPLPWQPSLAKALEKAKTEKKPVLICMHWANEVASVEMLEQVYRDPEVAQAMTRDFILVGTSPDAHEEIEVGGKKVSKLFLGVSCDTLVTCEHEVKQAFFSSPKVTVPQHIILYPSGDVALQKTYLMKTAKFRKFLADFMVDWAGKASLDLAGRMRSALETVKKGKNDKRKAAIREVVAAGDKRTIELLYHVIQGISKVKDRAYCIRAMGYEDLSEAGPILERWAVDSDNLIRNSAIVSLEETKYAASKKLLIGLLEKEKDAHIRKDIYRALGKVAGGDEEVKELLFEALKSKDELIRQAGYLSLQEFLFGGADVVRGKMVGGYKKEKRKLKTKGGIIVAYAMTRDADLIPDLDTMLAKERNKSLSDLGELARNMMSGEAAGWNRGVRGILKSIFAGDKIPRNAVAEWAGGGGGRGGRGGRRGR
jgi:predicted transcriptional regulator